MSNYFLRNKLPTLCFWTVLVLCFLSCQDDPTPDHHIDQWILDNIPETFNPDISSINNIAEGDELATEVTRHFTKSRCFLYRDAKLDSAEHYLNLISERMDDPLCPHLPGVRVAMLIDQAFLNLKYRNTQLAHCYSRQALLLSEKIEFRPIKFDAIILAALILYQQYQLEDSWHMISGISIEKGKGSLTGFQELMIRKLEISNLNNLERYNEAKEKLRDLKRWGNIFPAAKAEYYRLKGVRAFLTEYYELAINYQDSSIALYQSMTKPDPYTYSNAYFEKANAFEFNGMFDQALLNYESAMKILLGKEYQPKDLLSNISSITYLSGMGESLTKWAISEDSLELALNALDTFEKVEFLLNKFLQFDKDTYLQQGFYFSHYYTSCVRLLIFLYEKTNNEKWLKDVLWYIGKYKNGLYRYEAMLQRVYYDSLSSESHYVKDLVDLEKHYEQLMIEDSSSDEALQNHYVSRIDNLKERQGVYKRMKLKDGAIYDKLFKAPENHIDTIISNSKKDLIARVYFFIGAKWYNREAGYALLIDQGKLSLFKLAQPDSIVALSKILYNVTSGKDLSRAEPRDFIEISHSVYNLLFASIHQRLNSEREVHLYPDQELNFVPFDALIVSRDSLSDSSYKSMDYLNRYLDISLKFNVWEDIWENYPFEYDSNSVLGMGLSSKQTMREFSDIMELPSSIREIEMLRNRFPDGKYHSGNAFSKQNFLLDAPRSETIHISTHGEVQTNQRLGSWLLFRDNQNDISPLYGNEIMFKKIYPDLLVLSACKSSSGQVGQEQGVFSIARSFHTAGARKVISCLWALDDEVASYFFKIYYSNYCHATKLSVKKRAYLQKEDDTRCHPKFWAGVVEHK